MNTRYAKQKLFLGESAQQKLAQAKVLIIGAGALGSSSAEMLVRAGVGELTIIDRDYVEWSNLQRQQLYTEADVQQQLPKAVAAEKRLKQINSSIKISGIIADVHGLNIEAFVQGKTLVVDATDNFETSLIVNDAAVKQQVPYIFGACVGSYGLTLPIIPNETPCLHCLLGQLPLEQMTCDTVGVISPIVQVVAAMQVTLVLKWLAGEPIAPTLQSIDLWKDERATINIAKLKKQACLTCGEQATYPFLQFEQQLKAYVLCGRSAVKVRPSEVCTYELQQLADRLRPQVAALSVNPYLLSCQLENYRFVFFADGRAIIHGVTDEEKARLVYASFKRMCSLL